MKAPKLMDLHMMYWNVVNGTVSWKQTLQTNVPFTIARNTKRMHETDRTKNYPKGTFFIIVENGKDPRQTFIDKMKKMQLSLRPDYGFIKNFSTFE